MMLHIRQKLQLITVSLIYACLILPAQSMQDQGDKMNNEEPEAVFMVVSGITLDAKRMAEYSKAIADSKLYEITQGYYLNAPRPIEVFEGEVPEGFVTLMVKFPSLNAARDFWYSDAYQNKIKPLRENPSAGDYTVMVYREIDLPPYINNQIKND